MSGEIVVISVFGPAALGAGALIGAVALGSRVYEHIQQQIAERNRLALLQAQQIQADLERWQAQQAALGAQMHQALEQWQQLQQQIRQMPGLASTQDLGAVSAQGFLQHAQQQAQQQATQAERLQQLSLCLERLPEALSQPAIPALAGLRLTLAQLQQQQEQGPPPLASAIDSFQAALEQTLKDQAERLAQQPQLQAGRLQAAAALLQRLSSVEPLASGTDLTQLGELSQGLQQFLQQGLDADRLETQAFAELNEQAEVLIQRLLLAHENQLVDQQLDERLGHHLLALGYRHLASESGGERWAIPGGEQILARRQAGLRLAFQLQHERFADRSTQAALDRAELALLRQQEQRWCADLKRLMLALREDGFLLQVDFERLIPEEAVPVVLVEDVDDILRQQDAPGKSARLDEH
ncbi:MAG: hypothetical protein HQL47_04930 [Gammaproteobacteria bacterium]|nr:hypothetical protein [Gammaproteobacteria bacterium]